MTFLHSIPLLRLPLRRLVWLVLLTGLLPWARAEEMPGDKWRTVSGVVRDQETRRGLPYATIALPNNEVGTVSNADGEFILKIPEAEAKQLKVSHLGYSTVVVDLPDEEQGKKRLTIWMEPTATLLPQVMVSGRDPRELVEEALLRIDRNYANTPLLLTGFYRETARKRRHFINIAEAVVELTKTPYAEGWSDRDRAKVLKGRKLLSQKSGDTLAVKLLGGPTMGIDLDIVKNTEAFLTLDMMDFFGYQLESVSTIDDRYHYVVAFYPRITTDYALYHGRYFIDMETLTLTRAEFMLDLTDRAKATRSILHSKPASLRFRPVEVAYTVDYKRSGQRSRMNYVRSEICFKCDWKRKLFSTEYTVVSELVVTDSRPIVDGRGIARNEQFRRGQVLSDEASLFYDPDFWGDYNIIAPEESLEHAVKKLRKQDN